MFLGRNSFSFIQGGKETNTMFMTVQSTVDCRCVMVSTDFVH